MFREIERQRTACPPTQPTAPRHVSSRRPPSPAHPTPGDHRHVSNSPIVPTHHPPRHSHRDTPAPPHGLRIRRRHGRHLVRHRGHARFRRDRRPQHRRPALDAGTDMAGGRGPADRERHERGSRSLRQHPVVRRRRVGPDLRPRQPGAGGPHLRCRGRVRAHGGAEGRGTGGVHAGRFRGPLPERGDLGHGYGRGARFDLRHHRDPAAKRAHRRRLRHHALSGRVRPAGPVQRGASIRRPDEDGPLRSVLQSHRHDHHARGPG